MDKFLPGSASLIDSVDKKLMVSLRDGSHMFGWLRSYDQFGNLVLQDTVERTFLSNGRYHDIQRGIHIVRGENIVLLGEIDDDRIASLELEEDEAEAMRIYKDEQDAKKKRKELNSARLMRLKGFYPNQTVEDNY